MEMVANEYVARWVGRYPKAAQEGRALCHCHGARVTPQFRAATTLADLITEDGGEAGVDTVASKADPAQYESPRGRVLEAMIAVREAEDRQDPAAERVARERLRAALKDCPPLIKADPWDVMRAAVYGVLSSDSEDDAAHEAAWDLAAWVGAYWLAVTAGTRGRIDMVGREVGSWTVIAEAPPREGVNGKPRVMWVCQCSCGAFGTVAGDQLRRGKSQGCNVCRSGAVVRKPRPGPHWDERGE